MFAKIHSYLLAGLLTAALAVVAASCSGGGKDEEIGGSASKTDLRLKLLTSPLPVDSYKQMLNFDAEGSWSLTTSADWLLLSKASAIIG